MRILAITIGLLLALSASAQVEDNRSNEAKAIHAEGLRMYYAKDYKFAIKYFKECIALDNSFYMAYFNRGRAYMSIKAWSHAERDMDTVLNNDSTQVEALFIRGKAKFGQNNYKGAKEDLEKTLELYPGYVDCQKKLAITYYYLRMYDEAVELYSQILKENPKDKDSWYQIGLVKYYHGDFRGAIKDFGELIKLDDRHLLAMEMQGQCYQRANQIDDACSIWITAKVKGSQNAVEYLEKYCAEYIEAQEKGSSGNGLELD